MPSLLSFLSSKQQKTLGGLPEEVMHPAADLLRDYVEEVIPAHTGSPWLLLALDTAISKGPHASASTPEITAFIQREMQRRIKGGCSILLPASDTIILFGEKLKLSFITVVPQAHRRPRLILNLSPQPDSETPSVNKTNNKEAAPEPLQFGGGFPCILKAGWEAELVQVQVQVSKIDVTDACHRGTVKPSQVGAFAYAIPSAPGDGGAASSASTWSCR